MVSGFFLLVEIYNFVIVLLLGIFPLIYYSFDYSMTIFLLLKIRFYKLKINNSDFNLSGHKDAGANTQTQTTIKILAKSPKINTSFFFYLYKFFNDTLTFLVGL